jgi:hypothetical protein
MRPVFLDPSKALSVSLRVSFHFRWSQRGCPMLLAVEVSDSYHVPWIRSALSLNSLFQRETWELLLYSSIFFAFSVPFDTGGNQASEVLEWQIEWSTFSHQNPPRVPQYQVLCDLSKARAYCSLSASPLAFDVRAVECRLSTMITNPANTKRQHISVVVQLQTAYIW